MTDETGKIEHPEGGSTTGPDTEPGRTSRDDPLDLGAPMAPGEGHQGPEDALAIGEDRKKLRGDYTGRLGEGESYVFVRTGTRPDGTPIIERVRQK